MATTQSSNGSFRGASGTSVAQLDYTEIDDLDLRISLQRCEERILSYTQDMTDSLLNMAGEFNKAKKALAKHGNGQWARWVARFAGITVDTANRLAQIGEMERSELDALRSGIFAKSGGIYGIASYLSAPEPIQEQVQRGEVRPSDHAIRDAARAWKDAEDARKRAEEAEQRAREAEANVQSQIQAAQQRAKLEAEVELQKATAKLRREIDEAQHQAKLRMRDVEDAQRALQTAQADWQQRLSEATSKATQQEKERIEKAYTERMRDLQKQLEYQQRTADLAKQQAEELNERLAHARDSEAIRARWQMTAEALTGQVLQAIGKFPGVTEVSEFGADEWRLLENLRNTLQTAEKRLAELAMPNVTIIDA